MAVEVKVAFHQPELESAILELPLPVWVWGVLWEFHILPRAFPDGSFPTDAFNL